MNYVVKRGDTLTHIAEKYDVTVAALVAANGIKNPNYIQIGQVLKIPAYNLQSALEDCLVAIENLPEFKRLEDMLNG